MDLDDEVEAPKVGEAKEARPALDELEVIDDLEDKAAAVESSAPAGDLRDLLSDDDDLTVDW